MSHVRLEPHQLIFGPIIIEWDRYIAWPMQVNHRKLNGEVALITGCPITFKRMNTPIETTVPGGFEFDGASIPHWLWWVPGFYPMGVHLWAALCHDWLCVQANERPDLMDRELADAVFASLLKHTGVTTWRLTAMDLAVSAYRRWKSLRGILG